MVCATVAITLSICAQAGPSSDTILEGIRQKVRQNLTRLPDYTCHVTIQRSRGAEGGRRLQRVDTVHIEIGYVDGKELYAWPGQRFENANLEEMLPDGGSVATGDFALHVKAIFLSNAATFTYVGRSIEAGREMVRFQYRVPRAKSRYLIRTGANQESVVGYGGSFWADSETLLLRRLEIMVDEIPPQVRIRTAGSTLTYALARIGEAEFLLPQISDLFIVDKNGRESRNLTRFDRCRQYSGESSVSFADPAPLSIEGPTSLSELSVPPGILVEMILRSDLDGTRAAIGDPFSAVVSRDAVKAGTLVVPKGAKVSGRITRLGQITRGRVMYQLLGLRLSAIEFANRRGEFNASLESLAVAGTPTEVGRGTQRGETVLFVKGNLLHIPAGVHMYWRTGSSE